MKRITILKILFSIFALTTFQQSSAQNAKSERGIVVVVHRGANRIAPENTVPSALAALAHGATWVEVDVRRSKDGIMYNLHDETLDRTTNGKGKICDMMSDDIDKLDAGSWFNEKYRGLHVPRIAEMLDSLKGRANVFFDVKHGTSVPDLIDLVRQKGYVHNSFFWFADTAMLKEFISLAPEMKVKVNAKSISKLKEWMKICRPSYVETDAESITYGVRNFCRMNGIKIIIAVQGCSEDKYRAAIKTRPDMVNIDAPELFNKMLQDMNAK